MKSIEFEEQNIKVGEGQDEYQTLHGHLDREDPTFPITSCMELDEQERKEIAETGKIWLTQLTFGQSYRPIKMSTVKPDFPNHQEGESNERK